MKNYTLYDILVYYLASTAIIYLLGVASFVIMISLEISTDSDYINNVILISFFSIFFIYFIIINIITNNDIIFNNKTFYVITILAIINKLFMFVLTGCDDVSMMKGFIIGNFFFYCVSIFLFTPLISNYVSFYYKDKKRLTYCFLFVIFIFLFEYAFNFFVVEPRWQSIQNIPKDLMAPSSYILALVSFIKLKQKNLIPNILFKNIKIIIGIFKFLLSIFGFFALLLFFVFA